MEISNRLDWDIRKNSMWIATYKTGEVLVAPTKTELMSKINRFEVG